MKRNRQGYYPIGDNQYPSVTTVLGILRQEWAMPWVSKLASESTIAGIEKIQDFRYHTREELEKVVKSWCQSYKERRDTAADFGSLVHNAIEAYYKVWETKDDDNTTEGNIL